MKIALINTMTRMDTYVGTVLSLHRSVEAAEKADSELQRAVKRANGQNSYLPTIIREVDPKAKTGLLHESLVIA
jgi:Cu/Ag efflux protein CusF